MCGFQTVVLPLEGKDGSRTRVTFGVRIGQLLRDKFERNGAAVVVRNKPDDSAKDLTGTSWNKQIMMGLL
jgi:hypothetical protein